MKRILAILTFFLSLNLPAQFELKGLVIGVGGTALYQQSKFNHTDFSGITNWKYKARTQWAADARAKYYSGNRWQFGLATGIREAGWNKVNDYPEMEPHWEVVQFKFRYAYVDLSIGRTLFLRFPQLNWNTGITQYANLKNQWVYKYTDGTVIKLEDDLVSPEDFVTSCYAGIEYRILWKGSVVITSEYKCQIGLTKFHDRIMRGTQLHHSLGLNFYFGV